MKAVVCHGVGDIRLDEVPEPGIQQPTDAIVRLTAGAVCGTDLHFVRGTMQGIKEGRILGHEGVGVVEELGECIPRLIELVRTGSIEPIELISQQERLEDAVSAYEAFDQRRPGWLKVALMPAAAATRGG